MSVEAPKTAKRDALRAFEAEARTLWDKNKVFEVNAPSIKEHPNEQTLHKLHPKYMSCMAFPYMNGRLHLGHAFTFSKVDIGTGYERMKGKRALLPQGFHCTGMPIKACADKLKREIEMFGKNFEKYDEFALSQTFDAKAAVKNVKSKVAAKTGNVTYQFQIMLSLGIPRTELHRFADPAYWLDYFPPRTIEDMNAFGCKVDWRRSFITTDANPYYDSFVRWQMRKLREMSKIKFGERYTIYSIVDKQPCMDHDRSSGEAVGPQEYTGIKMEVLEWSESAAKVLKSIKHKVYLVAATLRPETMYGQTNCFVGTEITYGVYNVDGKNAYLCTERAARNMSMQKIFLDKDGKPTEAKIECLVKIKGSDVVGTKIHAPLSTYPAVYVLPMEGVLATKGTGVVTSVPSDSPDDYATLMDLKKKPEYYHVDPKWVQFDPIPVIETPTYGRLTAPKLCELKKINSQKDRNQLAEAKEIAYKEGFYQGTMCIGKYSGMKVQDAKIKIKDLLIESNEGFVYNEPESLVMSRSGDECVVALMDQWYIDYGEEQWKEKTKKCLSQLNTFTQETRNQFEQVLDWLNKWACARSFGLGTKLPWDEQFLVESLSDSTIYMAYYTVAHLLQGGSLNGSKIGPAGIPYDQLTDEVWDYVFKIGPLPKHSKIPVDTLNMLRREYEYFYPLDLRVSGKDLIPNHLTFFLYVHTAIFPENMWPRGIRSNGHLMLDSKKMSKSTGNFMTMSDAVIKYGADATRFALADAGDSVEDANFEDATANAAILRLHTLLEWCEEHVANKDKLRKGSFNFYDKIFENEMNKLVGLTDQAYEATLYREALKYGVFEFQAAKDAYQLSCADMHHDLIMRYIEWQALMISPVTPHWSEHVWSHVLKKNGLIVNALFPKPTQPVDEALDAATRYLRKTTKSIRDTELSLTKKKKKATSDYKPSEPKSLTIYVATKFPEWQDQCLSIMKSHYKDGQFDDLKIRQELGSKGMLKDKKVMPFVQEQKKFILKEGPVAFNRTLVFDECLILEEGKDELKRALGFHTVNILGHQQWSEQDKKVAESAVPGSPAFNFKNEVKK
ncbi:leucyl-tRNA synthetase [Pilobolus umbonatus]|nr:leucyl-tRNA synthetase [Pilobolus umbonatus]